MHRAKRRVLLASCAGRRPIGTPIRPRKTRAEPNRAGSVDHAARRRIGVDGRLGRQAPGAGLEMPKKGVPSGKIEGCSRARIDFQKIKCPRRLRGGIVLDQKIRAVEPDEPEGGGKLPNRNGQSFGQCGGKRSRAHRTAETKRGGGAWLGPLRAEEEQQSFSPVGQKRRGNRSPGDAALQVIAGSRS